MHFDMVLSIFSVFFCTHGLTGVAVHLLIYIFAASKVENKDGRLRNFLQILQEERKKSHFVIIITKHVLIYVN